MKENSIKEDIERLKLCSTNQCHICGRYEKEECILERNRCEQHLLSDYKRALKENEELNLKYYMLYTGKIENLKAQEVKIKSQVIPVQKVKDKIEKEIKYHERNILEIENTTMLKGKTAKEEAEIEFNKYAIVVLKKMLQELLEGRK